MRILAIADTEDTYLYDYFSPSKLNGIDLIISCGDLHKEYMEFLATVARVPLIYVKGNHDSETFDPGGCICIENDVYIWKGIRILGLGGSMRYRPGANQYTEKEMQKRILKMKRKIRNAGGVDIFVTHAPARGYGDLEDTAHTGFVCFDEFLMAQEPEVMVYGHVHDTYGNFVREREHPSGARIINACGRVIFDVPDRKLAKKEPRHGIRGLLRKNTR